MLQSVKLGYFGKAPSTGDFVARNVERRLRDPFDQWLQASLAQSRKDLGDDWLHSFLTAPVWRFIIAEEGAGAVTFGVMIPSVDKAGRYFPFAILGETPVAKLGPDEFEQLDQLLEQLEPLVLTVLDEDFDLDHFGYQLAMINRQLTNRKAPTTTTTTISDLLHPSRFANLAQVLEDISPYDSSLWWTQGSELRQAELVTFRGYPPVAYFSRMLRDPDVFAELELVWRKARDLALTQSDNGQVEINRRLGEVTVHSVCHPGGGARNCGFSLLTTDPLTLALADGRVGSAYHAMASRLICSVLPDIFKLPEPDLIAEELSKLAAFLAAKVKAHNVAILPMLSFALVEKIPEAPRRFEIIVAGEYMCLHTTREGARFLLPNARSEGDATTIRKASNGQYLSLTIDLDEGEALFVGSSAFLTPHLRDELPAVVAQASDPAVQVHAALEAALLRGVSANMAACAVGVAARAPAQN